MERNSTDIVAGLLVSAVGAVFLAGALTLGLGSAQRAGPGMFPLLVGGLTVGMGLVIALPALRRAGVKPEVSWRPLVAILAGIAAFGVTLPAFGLMPAAFVAVCIFSLADRTTRPLTILCLAAAAAVLCWLVFIVGLGMMVPAFRGL